MILSHTMIRVSNIEKALDFYTKLLDMKIVKQKEFDGNKLYFLTDETENVEIELMYNPQNKNVDFGKGFGHFGFRVKSISDFEIKMKELGLEYFKKPYSPPNSTTVIAFIKDFDGYEIELI